MILSTMAVCLHLLPALPSPGAAAAVVVTTDGDRHAGALVRWLSAESIRVRVGDKRVLELPTKAVDRVLFSKNSPIAAEGEWELRTTDGGRLSVDIIEGRDDAIRIRHALLGAMDVSWDHIRSFERRSATGDIVPVRDGRHTMGDRVVLRNGDVIAGSVSSAEGQSILMLSNDTGEEELISWRFIASLNMEQPSTTATTAPTDSFFVRLVDGAEIPAGGFAWESDEVRLATKPFNELTVAARRVAAVECDSADRVRLSRIPPERYESIPFFSTTRPLMVDRNAVGGELSIGGVAHARGFGLHSACRATWRLRGRYQRLTGLVGIDDSAGPLADAGFLIRSGDAILYSADRLRHAEPARPIDIDIGGVDELTLEVRFGRNGDVQDRVDLVNVILK